MRDIWEEQFFLMYERIKHKHKRALDNLILNKGTDSEGKYKAIYKELDDLVQHIEALVY